MSDFDQLIRKKKIVLVGKGLSDSDIDVLAKVLQKSDVVEEIILMCNNITLAEGPFVDALAENKTLKVLSLYNNQIGPLGAARLASALKVNQTLAQLFLEGNRIGNEGTEALASALMVNSSLQCLILRSNGIGDEGVESLANSFLFNKSLRVVLLGENEISNNGAQKLADALEYNTVIDQCLVDANNISPIMVLKIKTVISSASRKNPELKKEISKHVVAQLLEQKNKALQEKEAEIAALSEAKDAEIAKLKEEKDSEIVALNEAWDAELTKLKEEKEAELDVLFKSTEGDLAAVRKSKDNEIARLMEALNSMEEYCRETGEMKDAITKKDAEIAEKDGKIARREAVLKSKLAEIKAKDAQIAQLTMYLTDPMHLLQKILDEKDREIESLRGWKDAGNPAEVELSDEECEEEEERAEEEEEEEEEDLCSEEESDVGEEEEEEEEGAYGDALEASGGSDESVVSGSDAENVDPENEGSELAAKVLKSNPGEECEEEEESLCSEEGSEASEEGEEEEEERAYDDALEASGGSYESAVSWSDAENVDPENEGVEVTARVLKSNLNIRYMENRKGKKTAAPL